jgi:hypothetical protein
MGMQEYIIVGRVLGSWGSEDFLAGKKFGCACWVRVFDGNIQLAILRALAEKGGEAVSLSLSYTRPGFFTLGS